LVSNILFVWKQYSKEIGVEEVKDLRFAFESGHYGRVFGASTPRSRSPLAASRNSEFDRD